MCSTALVFSALKAPLAFVATHRRCPSSPEVKSSCLEACYEFMEEHLDLARPTLSFLGEMREALLGILAKRSAPEGWGFG